MQITKSSIMLLLIIAKSLMDGFQKSNRIHLRLYRCSRDQACLNATFYSMYNLSSVGKFHTEVFNYTMHVEMNSMPNLCKKNRNRHR